MHGFDASVNNCKCYRWFKRMCGICLLTCAVVVTCCIYCTLVLLKIRELGEHSKEVNQYDNNKSDNIYQMDVAILKKEVQKQVNNQVMSIMDRHRLKRDSKKRCKCPKLLAGHYEQRTRHEFFTDNGNYNDSKLIDTCKHIKQWNGKMCKSGDFKSDTKTLHVFEASPFLKKKSYPFKEVKDGKFVIKKKGTYLVYAQVSFYDSKEFQQMKVVHRKKKSEKVIREYACVRGIHNLDKNVNNTCSITALYFLDKGDYLTVDLFDTDLNLNFSADNTYFGAILLR